MDRRVIPVALLGLFLLIQLIPRRHSNAGVNPVEEFAPERSLTELALLRSVCYDCHSNETRYPWYAYVQPLALWIDRHVEEGRDELNFSIWHTYSMKRQANKLDECAEMLESGEMPLNSFTWAHPESRLSDLERQQLVGWFRRLRDEH